MKAMHQDSGLKAKKNYFSQLKQARYPYFGISFLFFSFTGLIVLAGVLVLRNKAIISNLNILPISFACLTILTIALYKFLARKINHDLRLSSFRKEKIVINHVFKIDDVEPGSGVLYIPILGDFFQKLWGQKMRKTVRYFLVSETKKQHEVDLEAFNLVKDQSSCYFIYGSLSNIRVDITL